MPEYLRIMKILRNWVGDRTNLRFRMVVIIAEVTRAVNDFLRFFNGKLDTVEIDSLRGLFRNVYRGRSAICPS